MTYVIKRKFQGLLGDDVDNSQMSPFIQLPVTIPSQMDSLTVNHLVVKQTLKIPVGVDKFK